MAAPHRTSNLEDPDEHSDGASNIPKEQFPHHTIGARQLPLSATFPTAGRNRYGSGRQRFGGLIRRRFVQTECLGPRGSRQAVDCNGSNDYQERRWQ